MQLLSASYGTPLSDASRKKQSIRPNEMKRRGVDGELGLRSRLLPKLGTLRALVHPVSKLSC